MENETNLELDNIGFQFIDFEILIQQVLYVAWNDFDIWSEATWRYMIV